jgi:hypothetical protein
MTKLILIEHYKTFAIKIRLKENPIKGSFLIEIFLCFATFVVQNLSNPHADAKQGKTKK